MDDIRLFVGAFDRRGNHHSVIHFPISWLGVYGKSALFFARETYVRRIWASEDEKFVIEDCQKSRELEAVRTGFHIDELNLICKFMPDKSFKNYYSEKLAEQRAASVIFGMIFIISAWFVLGKLIRYTAAMKLLRRRLSPHVSAGQMELDFGGADQK